MKIETEKFKSLLSKNYFFDIPYFQRYYDWDWNQTHELLLDFKELINNKYKNKKNHFLGFFVYRTHQNENIKFLELIDGQQRLTTLFLILKAINVYNSFLRKEWKEIINEEMFTIKNAEETNFKLKLRLNNDEKDNEVFESILKFKIFNWNSLNSWDDFLNYLKNTKEIKMKNKRMFSNFKHILDWLKSSNLELDDFLEVLMKCEIIEFDLINSEDNPQNVFESLNSKSKPLDDTDLIKNYIFMNIPFDLDQRPLYDSWREIEKDISKPKMSSFLKFYLMLETGKYIEEKNHGIFKSFKENTYINSKEDARKELEKIKEWYFIYLATPHSMDLEEYENRINREDDVFNFRKYKEMIYKNFNSLDGYSVLILMGLIKIFIENEEDKNYSKKLFVEMLKIIDSYLIRWKIVSGVGNLSGPLLKIYIKLKNSNIQNIIPNLKEEINSFTGQFKYSSDDEFKTFILNNPISNDNNKKSLLRLTENQLKKSYGIAIYNPKNMNIEHFMPKNPINKNDKHRGYDIDVEYFGNLILVEAEFNKNQLSNKDPKEKIEIIKNEIKNPTRYFTNSTKNMAEWLEENNINSWDVNKIVQRTEYLLDNILVPATTI